MEEKGDSMQRRLLSRLLKLAALSGTLFVGVRTCGSLFGGRSALVATINVSKEGAVAQQNPAGIVAGSARSSNAISAANAKKGNDGGGKKAKPPNMHSAAPADAVPPRPRNTRPRSSTTTVTQAKTTTYANGKRFPRRWLQFFSEQELSKSQQVADSLAEEVRDEMSFCWENYKKQAWGYDEVHPLRGGGRNTMGGIAVTILDSLDTLFLMDMKDEFFEAVDWIIGRNTTLSSRLAGSKVTSSNHNRNSATTQAGGPESERHANGLDFSRAGKASVFEIVIRGLGGLLGAYTMLTDGGNADFVSSTTSRPGEHDHGLTASRAALLLEKATDLGSRLLRAFTHSKSVFPLKEVQIGDVTRGWRTERATNIAEVGSLQLEFRALANFTNDFAQFKVLPDKSVTALIDIAEAHERRGLIPLEVTESSGDEDEGLLRELFGLPANHALGGGRGTNTNEAVVSSIDDPSSERARAELLATQSERQYENHVHVRGSHLSLGAGSDSFYEYLLKQFLQSGRVDLRYRDQFVKAMNEMIDTLVLKTPNYGQTFVGDATNQGRVWKMEHLTCYVPGLLVLAVMQIVGSEDDRNTVGLEETVEAAGTSESMKTAAQRVREAENAVKERWLNTAKGVAETCYNMYAVSPTGLSPEFVWMNRVADEDGTVFSAAAHPSEQVYSSGTSEPFVAGGADAGEPSSWSAVVLSTLGWSSAARPASRGGADHDAPGGSSRKTDIVLPNEDTGKYNLLRPETVESLYYLHYYTGDPKYREWGRNIFRSFQRYAKAGYGFASLDDVRKAGEAQDRQESFWMAETLKYLFLLFSPRETFDLSRFVFTTEGHVLKLPEK
eukprot:g1040.t1